MMTFLNGATCAASAAVALFFLRFWLRSRDRLFAAFALAFAVFAANRVVISAVDASEVRLAAYSLRAVAFVVIILAIVDKNRDG